ncbi:MAG: hypothetical protein NC483_03535 [Ruminococcus sp.]|nr:hypothetical protein [Ruminococcus sp.]
MGKVRSILNNKHFMIIIGAIIVVIIIIVCLFAFSNKNINLNKELETLGKTWYETYYWPNVGNDDEKRADTLSKYTVEGVTIDLNNLSKYPFSEGKIDLFVNEKTGEKCDTNKTKVTVIPTSPFGIKDYSIRVTLDCGLDN